MVDWLLLHVAVSMELSELWRLAAGLDSSRKSAMRLAVRRALMGAVPPGLQLLAQAELSIGLFLVVSISVAAAELATFAVGRRFPFGSSGKFRLAHPLEIISRRKEKTHPAAEPSILRC